LTGRSLPSAAFNAFKNCIKQGAIKQATNINKKFELTTEKTGPLIISVFGRLMEVEKVDAAIEIFKEYNLSPEITAKPVISVLLGSISNL